MSGLNFAQFQKQKESSWIKLDSSTHKLLDSLNEDIKRSNSQEKVKKKSMSKNKKNKDTSSM